MVNAYGGKCIECGEKDFIILVLDHINNDGKKDSKWGKRLGGFKFYQFLKRNNWPKLGLQLLCHNCNFRKEYIRRKNAVSIRETG